MVFDGLGINNTIRASGLFIHRESSSGPHLFTLGYASLLASSPCQAILHQVYIFTILFLFLFYLTEIQSKHAIQINYK